MQHGADLFVAVRFDSCLQAPYHARAMVNPLRDRRTPQDFAASGQVIEITEKLSGFPRLAEIVEADLLALNPDRLPHDRLESAVTCRLGFGFADAQRRLPKLEGHVEVTVDAVCQRCLEVFRLPVAADLRVVFGDGQSSFAGDDGYEIWELDEETMRPLDVVEEALIMALPFVATHPDGADCAGRMTDEAGPRETKRPFADLKSRMANDN